MMMSDDTIPVSFRVLEHHHTQQHTEPLDVSPIYTEQRAIYTFSNSWVGSLDSIYERSANAFFALGALADRLISNWICRIDVGMGWGADRLKS